MSEKDCPSETTLRISLSRLGWMSNYDQKGLSPGVSQYPVNSVRRLITYKLINEQFAATLTLMSNR